MKTILSGLLTLSLLTGGASTVFASSKKNHSSSPHKHSTTGKHRGSGVNQSGKSKSGNIPN